MKKNIGMLFCLFVLACTSNPSAPSDSQKSRLLGEGACAKPEKRDECIEALRLMAAQEKWGLFQGRFKELCVYGGAKCKLATRLKSGSKSPFVISTSGDSLFHQHDGNGEESYYFISNP